MAKDTKRMAEIQNNLVRYIESDLKTEEDHLYMATMLLKHSMMLYQSFLDDDQIKEMLVHVAENLAAQIRNEVTTLDDDNSGGTYH